MVALLIILIYSNVVDLYYISMLGDLKKLVDNLDLSVTEDSPYDYGVITNNTYRIFIYLWQTK